MKFDWRIVIVAAIVLIFWNMSTAVPKEAVADIQGKVCTLDADCPCLGSYNTGGAENISAVGIGKGNCVANACDMKYCYALEPLGDWLVDHPLDWMKQPANIGWVMLIAGLTAMLIFWPKR